MSNIEKFLVKTPEKKNGSVSSFDLSKSSSPENVLTKTLLANADLDTPKKDIEDSKSEDAVDLTKSPKSKNNSTPKLKKKNSKLLDLVVSSLLKMKERSGVSFAALKTYLFKNNAKQLKLGRKTDDGFTPYEKGSSEYNDRMNIFSKRLAKELRKATNEKFLVRKKGQYFVAKAVKDTIKKKAKEIERQRRKKAKEAAKVALIQRQRKEQAKLSEKEETKKEKPVVKRPDSTLINLREKLARLEKDKARRMQYHKSLQVSVEVEEIYFDNSEFEFSLEELKREEFMILNEKDPVEEIKFTLNFDQWNKLIHISEFVCFHSHPEKFRLSRYSMEMLAKSLLENKINTIIRETHLVLLDTILNPDTLASLPLELNYMKDLLSLEWYAALNLMTWQEILRRFLLFLSCHNLDEAAVMQRVALKLEMKDYNFLLSDEKLSVLCYLVEVAVQTPTIHRVIDSKSEHILTLGKEQYAAARREKKRRKEIEAEFGDILTNTFLSTLKTAHAKARLDAFPLFQGLQSCRLLQISDQAGKRKSDLVEKEKNKKQKQDENKSSLKQLTLDGKVASSSLPTIKEYAPPTIDSLSKKNLNLGALKIASFDISALEMSKVDAEKLENLKAEWLSLDQVEKRAEELYIAKFMNKRRLKCLGRDRFGNCYYALRSDLGNIHVIGHAKCIRDRLSKQVEFAAEEEQMLEWKIGCAKVAIERRQKELELARLEEEAAKEQSKDKEPLVMHDTIVNIQSRMEYLNRHLEATLKNKIATGELNFRERALASNLLQQEFLIKNEENLATVNEYLYEGIIKKIEAKDNASFLRKLRIETSRYIRRVTPENEDILRLKKELAELSYPVKPEPFSQKQQSCNCLVSRGDNLLFGRISGEEGIVTLMTSLDDESNDEQQLRAALKKLLEGVFSVRDLGDDCASNETVDFKAFDSRSRPKRKCVKPVDYQFISSINSNVEKADSTSTNTVIEVEEKEKLSSLFQLLGEKEKGAEAMERYINVFSEAKDMTKGLFVLDLAPEFANVDTGLFIRMRLSRNLPNGEQPDYLLNWIVAELSTLFSILNKNGARAEPIQLTAAIKASNRDCLKKILGIEAASTKQILGGELGKIKEFVKKADEENTNRFAVKVDRILKELEDIYGDAAEVGKEDKSALQSFNARIRDGFKQKVLDSEIEELSSSRLPQKCVHAIIKVLLLLENCAYQFLRRIGSGKKKPSTKKVEYSDSDSVVTDDSEVSPSILSDVDDGLEEHISMPKELQASQNKITAQLKAHVKEMKDICKTQIYIPSKEIIPQSSEEAVSYLEAVIERKEIPLFSDSILVKKEVSNKDSWLVRLLTFHKEQNINGKIDKKTFFSYLSDDQIDSFLEVAADFEREKEQLLKNVVEQDETFKLEKVEKTRLRRYINEDRNVGEVLWKFSTRRLCWLEDLCRLSQMGTVSGVCLAVCQLSRMIYNDSNAHLYKKRTSRRGQIEVIC
eukprot:augustus_masked-scaffold_5-processed-gene-2.11-mRNA-1 protein AED:1.00 eAED:1.00 QI:0/-1/0/0/-1/1/1/0/1466